MVSLVKPDLVYTTIEWVGDSRELPEHGICEIGRVLDVKDTSAIDLISRGFAIPYSEPIYGGDE